MDRSPRPRTPSPPRPGSSQARGRALRVHVVDADGRFAHELAGALEAHGMIARVIGSGRGALAAAEAARPDLIVLCAELPDVSGYAVCSRLKRNRETAAIPIILTSGQADTRSFRSHQRLWVRAEAYLRKPFDPAPLSALLQRAATLVQVPAERREPEPAPSRAGPARPVAGPRPAVRERAEEILEDGFEYLGGGADPEILEEGFVYLGGGQEPLALDDGLVQLVERRPEAPAARADEVLEDGFVYLGGGTEPRVLEDSAVYLTGLEALVGGAARTAPGRWKLPAGIGAAA